jgi:hypothetical protein
MPLRHKHKSQPILTSDPQRFTLLRIMSVVTMVLLAVICLGTLSFFLFPNLQTKY